MSMVNIFFWIMLVLIACLSYLLIKSETRAEVDAARQWAKLAHAFSCSSETSVERFYAERAQTERASVFQTVPARCGQQNSGMVRRPVKAAFFEIDDRRDAANTTSVIEYTLPRLLSSDRGTANREQEQKDSTDCPFCA